MKVKVRALQHNQYIIDVDDASYFQSYNTIIAKIEGSKVYLDKTSWDYSATTGKYRKVFLGEGIVETRKKVLNGTYLLTDLNEE